MAGRRGVMGLASSHRTTLFRSFQGSFGVSPSIYLHNRRMEAALALLHRSDVRIKEVSVTYFNTVTQKVESPPTTVTVTQVKVSSVPKTPSLADALIAAGCRNFLRYLQSNPDAWALANSDRTHTVFAPSDAYFQFNGTVSSRDLFIRDERDDFGALSYQTSGDYNNIGQRQPGARLRARQLQWPIDKVISTNLKDALLNGSTQKVVSDSRRGVESGSGTLAGLVRLDSGLGNAAHVVNPDYEYDRGLIQVTDRYAAHGPFPSSAC